MEFILGSFAQYPFPSSIYTHGVQIKTTHPIELKPNEIKTIKSNIIIKHSRYNHLQLFLANDYTSIVKLHTYMTKSIGKVLEYTIENITDNDVFIHQGIYLIDVVLVEDLTYQVHLINDPEIASINLEENNSTTNEQNNVKPLSLNDEQVAEPVIEQVAEPVIEQVVESVVEQQVVEPVIEQVAEPIIEQVAEPVVEQVAEPVVEPAVKPKRSYTKKKKAV
jgi:hypothetical protein